MPGKKTDILITLFALCAAGRAEEFRPRNVIFVMADDISAREFPIYGSTAWTGERAKTPVLDRMGTEGCFIETVWACALCKPSRAMMMTGRYAHRTKFWDNSHIGQCCRYIYSPYRSSPITLGTVSRDSGYANIWLGKNHIGYGGDSLSFGFNEMIFHRGDEIVRQPWSPYGTPRNNPYETFKAKDASHWSAVSVFWWPSMMAVSHPAFPDQTYTWIKTEIDDYGPDIELAYALEFIDRMHASQKPFFVYYTPYLGHQAIDHADPANPLNYPGTPVIEWTGNGYVRKDPKHIALGDGKYRRENITGAGIHHHIEYLDYQMWQLIEKLKEIGELENTVILFTTDNGTYGYGKGWIRRQRGQHVPLMIYAPGENLVKGRQNIVSDFSDMLPTLAEIMGFTFPDEYEVDGKSLWPYLTGASKNHRDWIYSYRVNAQLIRNDKVMRDGFGEWFDVRNTPSDFDSFTRIEDVPNGEDKDALLKEKERLDAILPQFDLYQEESEAPLPPAGSTVNGLPDAFRAKYPGLEPDGDEDGNGVSNFLTYVFGGDPLDPASPSKEQLPHEIEISDAQGTYLALKFQRREELGPDYLFMVEGTRDGKRWSNEDVMQQHTVRSNGDGTETVIARAAVGKDRSPVVKMRVTVKPPLPRKPVELKDVITGKGM